MKNPGITAGSIEMKSQYSRVDEHIIDKSTPGTASESKSSAGSPHYLCQPQWSQVAHAKSACNEHLFHIPEVLGLLPSGNNR